MGGPPGPKGTNAMLTPLCFFMISVSYKLAWTTISSLLSQYSRDYGPQVLLQLNIAYFLPSIPVLMLQATLNDSMDRRLGSTVRGSSCRFLIGLGGLVLLTATFPSLASTHARLLAMTTCVGLAYGVAFGTSYQLASRFPPINTVMLTTGFVSSGPLVLLLDLAIKRGTYYSPQGLAQLFSAVSWFTGLGLVAALLLVGVNSKALALGLNPQHVDMAKLSARLSGDRHKASRSGKLYGSSGSGNPGGPVRHRADAMSSVHDNSWLQQHDGDGVQQHHAVMMVDSTSSGTDQGLNGSAPWQQHHDHTSPFAAMKGASQFYDAHDGAKDPLLLSYDSGKRRKPELPLSSIARRISPAALSIFLSVGTSMLVFPFFTYMHSTGLLGERLPQVLFYVRLVGDILGRLVPRRLQATTVPRLMFWALVKTAMVPVLFGCIFSPHFTGGDLGAVVIVGLFWVLSGYVNTCAYLVAPTLVHPAAKPRASGLMTVAFQSSCLIALLGAAAIQRVSR